MTTARAKALDIISRRPHTEFELKRKLLNAGYPQSETADALEYLKGLGYLEDETIASDMARTLAMRRNLGPARIKAKLRSRGIPEAVVETALAEAMAAAPQKEAAIRALEKKFRGPGGLLLDDDKKRRASQYLFRMGFDWDIISSILKHIEPGE